MLFDVMVPISAGEHFTLLSSLFFTSFGTRFMDSEVWQRSADHFVCAVQEESPLQVSPRLSEQYNNTIMLKREDMQPVSS